MGRLRQVQDSISSFASGIQRYGSPCDLQGVPYFPPTADTAPKWSAALQLGGAFGMYLIHSSKACLMLGYGLEWRTASFNGAPNGLRNATDMMTKFDN